MWIFNAPSLIFLNVILLSMTETSRILAQFFSPDGPGAVVAHTRGSEAPTIECYGYANIETKKLLSPSALFDLASVTKSFTGAAVALLYERGDLRVDAPLGDYLPSLEQPFEKRPVTVQDLLWHTSDLPDYLGHFSEDRFEDLTNDDVITFAEARLSECRPGKAFAYSNTNYALLASILERVSGKSYAELLEGEIFRPLNLANMRVLTAGWHDEARPTGYVNARMGGAEFVESRVDIKVLGDGGVFSTAADLVRWFQAFAKGQLLQNEGTAKMFTPGSLDNGETLKCGWGVAVKESGRGRWFGHTGGWYGVSTFAGHDEATDTTLVILSNEERLPIMRLSHMYSGYLASVQSS